VRSFHKLWLLCALATAAVGQDRHDWQSLAQLQAGERVRVSLKTGPLNGEFQKWTPQAVTVATVTARREDVLKIERYRHGRSRGEHIAIGAVIGFGGGFAAGASVRLYGASRPQGGAYFGGVLAGIGALVGAILPVHSKEVIYSSR
jgi:hypothetical protein